LQPWTHYYNHHRPHGSLNYKPPISRSDTGTTSWSSTATLIFFGWMEGHPAEPW